MDFEREIGALVDGKTGKVIKPSEVRRRIAERKDMFAKEGLLSGDRVVLSYGNCPEFFIDLLAVWGLNACAIPFEPSSPPAVLNGVLEESQAQAHIVGDAVQRFRKSTGRETGEALVLYTSGTSAGPKGVVHSFSGLASKFVTLSKQIDTSSWRRVMCLLPIHFGHGLICNSLWPWLASKDLVIFPSSDLEVLSRLGDSLDRHQVDFFSSVPSVWQWLLHTDVPSPQQKTLKRIHCASAPLDRPGWLRAAEWAGGVPIVNVYGTTETAGWIAGTEPGEPPDEGFKGWDCEFTVRNSENGAGNIWVTTAALMRGYLGQPDLTSSVVQSGWYRTGDAGRIDDRGRVHLQGRTDDLINKAGIKVYPDEIEAVVRKCDGVEDVCVFGVPHEIFGQEVAAAVVLRSGILPRVRAWCEERLLAFKVPRIWYELSSIPRNERGKVSRRTVAALCKDL